MKYLVFSYNDHDFEWSYFGLVDSFEESEKLASEKNWPQKPFDLNFTLRKGDVLENTFSAPSGQDQYFIMPVVDRSE